MTEGGATEMQVRVSSRSIRECAAGDFSSAYVLLYYMGNFVQVQDFSRRTFSNRYP